MEREDGEAQASAGQDCPAQGPTGATSEITINGERLSIVQATAEQQAAIEKGEGKHWRVVGLKLAGVLFLFAAVGGGLACGLAHHGPQCAQHGAGHGGHNAPPHATARHSHKGRRRKDQEEGQMASGQ